MMPLEGLTVIDASTILAGPLCCQILGDYGADVIKIEHPVHGDSMRGHGGQKDGIPLCSGSGPLVPGVPERCAHVVSTARGRESESGQMAIA